MPKGFRVNYLLLFLLFGIATLFVFTQNPLKLLVPEQKFGRTLLNVDDQIRYNPGNKNLNPYIELFNEDLVLYYSLDGGASFVPTSGKKLQLNELQNPKIIYQNTAIRWRQPRGDLPFLKNIVVKVLDPISKIQSNEKFITAIETSPSELPIVSLTIKNNELFGYHEGIMVYGEAATKNSSFHDDWWFQPANFVQRGKSAERSAYFQYFEKGVLRVEQSCKMKISGNTTRYFPQKSFKLSPSNPRVEDKINYAFWGEQGNKKSESLLFRNSGNDNTKTMFADLFIHEVCQQTNVLTQGGFPVSVFLNGNYWGIYNLRERIDQYFIAKREGEKAKNVTILMSENSGTSLLKEGDIAAKIQFDSLINTLNPSNELKQNDYEKIATMISVKSFIDYILIESFFANQDWLYNNTTWYRAGEKKWKWLLNDVDFSMAYPGSDNVNFNMFMRLKKSNSVTAVLFNSLMQSKKFKKKFKKRAQEMAETILSKQFLFKTFMNVKSRYANDIELHIGRWKSIESKVEWEQNCKNNEVFLSNRLDNFKKQLEEL